MTRCSPAHAITLQMQSYASSSCSWGLCGRAAHSVRCSGLSRSILDSAAVKPHMRAVAIVLTALVAGQVAAQEYMPYPGARITLAQWQQYFSEVSSKHAASRREFPAEHLVVFEDRATYTAYAFTQPGHAAHPSWITRHVIHDNVGVKVRQIGYFAGDEGSFAKLFEAYQQLNAQLLEDFQSRSREGQK